MRDGDDNHDRLLEGIIIPLLEGRSIITDYSYMTGHVL